MAITISAALLSPQTPPVLRTETRVVQIDVEVVDSRKQPVPGLTRDDFTVTDAGKRRSIQIFSVQSASAQSAGPPASAAAALNVFSNRAPSSTAHATVILLDAINNYWDDFAAARLRLLTMAGKLATDERIAVYAATTRPAGINVIQDFTTDRARLLRTLQAYSPPPIAPAPGMIPAVPVPAVEEEMRRRVALLDTMSAFRLLSVHLAKLPGRKSLLWLTSGLPPRQLREMPDSLDKAAAALNDANVSVNVMDDDGVGDIHRRWGREAFWTLRQLADSTGGKAFLGRNDLDNMLVEAIQAPRITYTLGFYLPDGERDDKFHPLTVRVNRRGLDLSYRKGYYAGTVPLPTAPKKREAMENALLDPEDSNEIPITAEVTVTEGSPRAILRVSMRVDTLPLTLTRKSGGWSGKLETMFLETNAAGQLVARVADSKTFEISQRIRDQFDKEGMPLVQEVGLVAGATRLLIVLRDSGTGRTGTLSVPLVGLSLRKQE